MRLKLLALILTTFFIFSGLSATERSITIGSKNFGENFLLAEILALMLESEGFSVDRAFGLGGTLICYEALRNEEIDLYFEYTGTLSRAVLNLEEVVSEESLAEQLLTEGLFMMPRLGFNNTYAIAVRRETANLLKGKTIGALGGQEDLKVVFSHEFLEASFRPCFIKSSRIKWSDVLGLSSAFLDNSPIFSKYSSIPSQGPSDVNFFLTKLTQ